MTWAWSLKTRSSGIAPDEVSGGCLTSMHADRVGGLLAPNAQRQYKNAQLFASAAAMQYWLADYSYVQALMTRRWRLPPPSPA